MRFLRIALSAMLANVVWHLFDGSYMNWMQRANSFQSTSLDTPIPGYWVEDFEWEVQTFVDGPKMNIIEKVHSELLKLNPDWNEHFMNATSIDNQPTDGGADKHPHRSVSALSVLTAVKIGVQQ